MSTVESIGINYYSEYIYFTDSTTRRICIASYDGNLRRELPFYNLISPRGLYVDLKQGYLYWTDSGRSVIERSRLDGSKRELVISSIKIAKSLNGVYIEEE